MIDILMFHRILPKVEIKTDDAYYLRGTLISTQRLETVIQDYLKNDFIFKTIEALDHKSSKKQVALTFDDGHLDHFEHAFPILEKYGIKGTFYPVISYCRQQRPSPLDIYYNYVNNCIAFEDKNNWIKGVKKKEFLALSVADQQRFVEKLPPTSECKVSYMKIEHLRKMQSLGHQIGGHSMYHDIYTQMHKSDVFEDIKNSIIEFKKIGIDINSYAYPNGDYNLDTIFALKNNNIKTACVIKSQNLTSDINYELERRFVKENEII